MAVNERFIWATNLLKPEPDDQLLEIGCGSGIFLEQIAAKLTTGKIIGIDKSPAIVKMAAKRNKQFLEQGTATLEVIDFENASFKKEAFDKILSFNVNVFWKNPEKGLDLVRKYLKPDGLLYIFYQTPYGITTDFIDKLTSPLQINSFEVTDTVISKNPISSVCIIARADGAVKS